MSTLNCGVVVSLNLRDVSLGYSFRCIAHLLCSFLLRLGDWIKGTSLRSRARRVERTRRRRGYFIILNGLTNVSASLHTMENYNLRKYGQLARAQERSAA